MNIQTEDLQILGKFGSVLSIDKMDEAFRIVDEMIVNLDDVGLREMMGGYEADIDEIYKILLEETYATLYGRKNNIDLRIGYLDNITTSIEETLCIENLTYFITSKMPQFDLNWHHLEWGDCAQRYDKNNIIAARDHGKSYFWSNAYLAWKMFRYKPATGFTRPRKDLQLSKRGFL